MSPGSPGPRGSLEALEALEQEIVVCRRCPRLVEWREQVAMEKRASFADETYWGRPVPGFGDPAARILVVGLAPAAHGANRTGRVFTGDRSGDFLFAALHRAGLANQPTSVSRDDGLLLRDVWVAAAVRCAPPANKPTPDERDNCLPYLVRELEVIGWETVIVLGQFAYDVVARLLGVRPRPRFGHGVEVPLDGTGPGPGGRPRRLVCSFHPSQQNTFTGKLTPQMMDSLIAQALGGT